MIYKGTLYIATIILSFESLDYIVACVGRLAIKQAYYSNIPKFGAMLYTYNRTHYQSRPGSAPLLFTGP